MPDFEKPSFAPTFWELLAAETRIPGTPRVTAEDARLWFDYVWLEYRVRWEEDVARTPRFRIRHKARIANWWKRATREELKAARALAQDREEAKSDEALLEAARALPSGLTPGGSCRQDIRERVALRQIRGRHR